MTDLSVSIVVWQPDWPQLELTLSSLAEGAREARDAGLLGRLALVLVDNGPQDHRVDLHRLLVRHLPEDCCRVLGGHGNVGYGRGHNLALAACAAPLHLILNPDVQLFPDALRRGLEFLRGHPDVGLLTPRARGRDGRRQMLTKRYPSVLDLALRGFAPGWVRRRLYRRLHHYEMRDVARMQEARGIPIVSGCFMLFRREILDAAGGFDPEFFLYFEDFDLSLRAARLAQTAYVPSVRISHAGGGAAAKGLRHIGMFGASALRFYTKHGWRWW